MRCGVSTGRAATRAACIAGGLLLLAMLSGCRGEASELKRLLPDGCYYDEDGVPILKVVGARGTLLIPGRMRQVTLTRGWWPLRDHVDVDPGFFLQDSPRRAGEDPEPHKFSFDLEKGAARPTTVVPLEASGYTKVALGKAC
jgi:hypothetical protein